MKVAKVLYAANSPLQDSKCIRCGGRDLKVSSQLGVVHSGGDFVGYTTLQKTKELNVDRVQVGHVFYEIYPIKSYYYSDVKYCICVDDVANKWLIVLAKGATCQPSEATKNSIHHLQNKKASKVGVLLLAVGCTSLALVILLASNVSTRDYINTDYSSIASEATSGTEEQLIIVMMLTKYYYDFYRDQDILELYKQATGQNVDKYTEDVQTWFNSQLEQHFSEGGAQLSEEDTIALIQQYNQINSASTMMYTKLFGTTGVPVYDENDIESKKAFNQMKKLIESAAEKEPLYNTTGLYELVEKYTYNKYTAYHNTYFHWWFYLIAVIALVVVYNVPMFLMQSKEEELQIVMQDEVIQYHAIILLLIYFENVNALTILEWMNIFSEVFTTSIARCITDFTMNEQDALQKLYDSEPYEPFQRIVENLMMVDDVGVLQAFNELSATRKSNQESRSQDNKNIIAKRAEKAGMLMQAPLWYVALGYLVGPMIIEAFKQMANMVSEISTM